MRSDGASGLPPDVAIHTARQQLAVAIYFNQRPPAPKAITVRLGHAESTAIGLRCSERRTGGEQRWPSFAEGMED